MNELDFALVPIGIVLGYGITQVMQAWASAIRVSPRERGNALLFFSANGMVLVFMYLNFSGLWAYRDVEFVILNRMFNVAYLFALTMPMLLFMLSVSVLVDSDPYKSASWNMEYMARSRRFFIILALALSASFLPDLLPGVSFAPDPAPGIALIGFFIFLAINRKIIVHTAMHIVFWLGAGFLLGFQVFQGFALPT